MKKPFFIKVMTPGQWAAVAALGLLAVYFFLMSFEIAAKFTPVEPRPCESESYEDHLLRERIYAKFIPIVAAKEKKRNPEFFKKYTQEDMMKHAEMSVRYDYGNKKAHQLVPIAWYEYKITDW